MRAYDSIIYICRQVRLDVQQKNTIFWQGMGQPVNVDKTPGRTAQLNYFSSKAKYTFTEYMYIRQSRRIRIELNPEDIIDCNYIVFRNKSFGTHWYFGFITATHYINDNTCEIEWVLDSMQTYAFDFELQPSYIERAHVTQDAIGQNRIPENFEHGDYVFTKDDAPYNFGDFSQCRIYIASTVGLTGDPAPGKVFSGIYQGCTFFPMGTEEAANNMLTKMTEENNADAVVSVFMFPSTMNPGIDGSDIPISIQKMRNIDGYAAKNNKLYQYPYIFLYMTDNEGAGTNLKYENFGGDTCDFNYAVSLSCSPQILMYPRNYEGIQENYGQGISVLMPQCSYNIDTFKAWLAQNAHTRQAYQDILDRTYSRQTTSRSLRALANTGMNLATGNYLGMVNQISSALTGQIGGDINYDNEIAMINATMEDHSTLPPQSKGTARGDALWSQAAKGVSVYHVHIRKEFAKIIDDFWTLYGYPIHALHVPILDARENWTYVKTQGVNVNSVVENLFLQEIKEMFNAGITFWKNPDKIGEYGLGNSITGGGTY